MPELRQMSFAVFTILAFAYALCCGGRPERQGVVLNLVASLLSVVAVITLGWGAIYPLLVIDIAVCIGFLEIAARSDRYWPIWSLGMAIPSVVAHLAKLIGQDSVWHLYQRTESFWAWPALTALIVGTWFRQARQKTANASQI